MNERIRSLIERAEYQVGKQYGPDWEVYVEPSREQILEKFAELIIQECLMVCKKTEQYEVGNQYPDEVGCIRAGAVFCREDIIEHFGVNNE